MRYNAKTDQIELSVTELCPRSAATARVTAADDIDVMLPELFAGSSPRDISIVERCGNIDFLISGRAAAVSGSVESPILCEATLASGKGGIGNSANEIVLLAYMLCREAGLQSIDIETITYNRLTGESSRTSRRRSAAALGGVMQKCLERKRGHAAMLKARSELILSGAATVTFPFSCLRRGQDIMMQECYGALRNGEILFVQAPTGIGKTISSFYPAVKLLGNGRCDKIFYLTAKTSTQNEAYKAAGRLFEAGAHLRTVVLSAKEQCCTMRGIKPADVPCSPVNCRFAGVGEDKYNEAVNSLLTRQSGYERSVIVNTAREYGVCPYELSLALSEYCEIIIADYNYAFDPMVRLRRYFENQYDGSRYVFLVDEAHNLADRTRSMYSAEITSTELVALYEEAKAGKSAVAAELGSAIDLINKLRVLCRDDMTKDENGTEHGFYTGKSLPDGLVKQLLLLDDMCMARIFAPDEALVPQIAALHRRLTHFMTVAGYFDERFLFYCEVDGDDVILREYCLDPSALLEKQLDRISAAVMFSATLTPLDYFSDILGGGHRSRTLALESPFDISNLMIAAVDNISTRYDDREKTLQKIVSYIAAAVAGRKGNYIVYFPSYRYMEKAASLFSAKFSGVSVLIQKRGMSCADKERFLGEFRLDDGAMRVGFCVLGGSFSEGIDLPGSRLIGVVVVGVGMPGLSSERNIMRDYYELSRECGYDYAYTYPGMNNVMQAAGRVIRGEGDRGVVVLIDDRYASQKYMSMYPDHWRQMQYFESAASLNAAVNEFWKQNPN